MNHLEREARRIAWKVVGNSILLIIIMEFVCGLFGCSPKRIPMQTRAKYEYVK